MRKSKPQATDTHRPPPSSGLPRRLKVAMIKVFGLALAAGGAWLAFGGRPIEGVVLFVLGVDVAARPTASRWPRWETLVELADRLWSGRGP